MIELKPCPFCGEEAHIVSDYSSEYAKTRWSLWHECEGHEGGSAGYGSVLRPWFETPWYDTEEEAAEAWNTRAEQTCRFVDDSDGEFPPKCSACGYQPSIYECSWLIDGGYEYEGNYCANCGAKVEGTE